MEITREGFGSSFIDMNFVGTQAELDALVALSASAGGEQSTIIRQETVDGLEHALVHFSFCEQAIEVAGRLDDESSLNAVENIALTVIMGMDGMVKMARIGGLLQRVGISYTTRAVQVAEENKPAGVYIYFERAPFSFMNDILLGQLSALGLQTGEATSVDEETGEEEEVLFVFFPRMELPA